MISQVNLRVLSNGNKMSFVHLHVHTQYSLLEATIDSKKLVERASAFGMPAVAITDNGNMFGVVEFYKACNEKGIKPILGMDVYIAPHGRHIKGDDRGTRAPNERLVLLAQDYIGYQTLCKLSTIGFQEGFYYKPRIDYDILSKYNQNIICLTGGLRGPVANQFLNNDPDKALEKLRLLNDIFSDRVYVELQRPGTSQWTEVNNFLIDIAKTVRVPAVATNDIYYLDQKDNFSLEVMICIGSNKTLQDETRFKLDSDQFFFKSSDQMRNLFKDLPEACDRTLEIADRCNFKFKLKDEKGKPIYHLPSFPTLKNRPLKDEIKDLAEKGLEKRFLEQIAHGEEEFREENKKLYYTRLNYELDIINKMGFNGYFLIVQDFIGWAKNQNIPVGPGRGSGAGSLVAYSLGITDLDPIKNKLIFERFLNPERISMPDFDIDFCQDRRGEVIRYVSQKYGEASVSQIITFGKLQARAAIRDVGRVMGMTFSEVDVIAKLVPEKLGITLAEALNLEPRFRELMEADPKINSLIETAQNIEGLNRHASIHAAGVVISDKPLVEHAPLYKGVDGENVIQYDMKNSETIGLIKFDFLGLKTLTMMEDAVKLIEKNKNKKISIKDISMKDHGIYEIMSTGNTAGIFQFEGDGISDLIQKVKPSLFEDIVAINALYRPGPMQMLDEYVGRKNGSIAVTYLFQELEDILKETYGIVVYQEQVQLIAARIAKYSLGEADILRRAMGKKIAKEMEAQRARFLEGAKANGFDEKKSMELFDLLAKFAEYGFNKSHAAAYCVIAGQTAWLKRYYPTEFYAALLSTELGDTDKTVKYVKEVRRQGIIVNPPDINYSDFKFSVSGEKIFFGLGGIKGVGGAAVEAILEARTGLPGQKFENLEDFFSSVDLRRVNKKVIECLIKAGAFDSIESSRAKLYSGYNTIVEQVESDRKDKEIGQSSLFSLNEETQKTKVELPNMEEWPKTIKLNYEKEVLGLYITDHPLSGYEGILRPYIYGLLGDIKCTPPLEEKPKSSHSGRRPRGHNKPKVVLGGIITLGRELITKKGTRMAFANLEDSTGTIELIVFPDIYAQTESLIKSDGVMLVEGALETGEQKPKLMVEKITPLELKIKESAKMIISVSDNMAEKLDVLKKLIEKYPGNTQVYLKLVLQEIKQRVTLRVTEPLGVKPQREFFDAINLEFGKTDFIEML